MEGKTTNKRNLSWDRFWSAVRLEEYVSKVTCHDRLLVKSLISWLEHVRIPPERQAKRILEIGCAYSKNLFMIPPPTGKDVFFLGLDSCKGPTLETGLNNPYSNVNVIVGDFFNSPIDIESLDMIISFGLIEHFRTPAKFLEVCYHMLYPGGRLVVGYPSYRDLTGRVQRVVDPQALKYHFSLPCSEMALQITSRGFTEVKAEYFGPFNPNMINWGHRRFKKLLMYSAFAAVRPLEWLVRIAGTTFASETFSSYVMATGIKPE